ncbi:MAG: hypothetical protein K2Q18_05780 [Bdellovibrionales bacterium]|nr:hypothetical protein [Bdellovibrionales bacterium]
MAAIFSIISLIMITNLQAFEGPPPHGGEFGSAPEGMGHPGEPMFQIKFEFDKNSSIYKDEDHAIELQTLYEKYHDDKEVKEYLDRIFAKNKSEMKKRMNKSEGFNFEEIKKSREKEKILILTDLKKILENLKLIEGKVTLADKCEEGKTPKVLEKSTTDSLKDTDKVVKIVLTEQEFIRMKQDIKKELMAEMEKAPPKEKRADEEGRPKERGGEREMDPLFSKDKKNSQNRFGPGESRGFDEAPMMMGGQNQKMGGQNQKMGGMDGMNMNGNMGGMFSMRSQGQVMGQGSRMGQSNMMGQGMNQAFGQNQNNNFSMDPVMMQTLMMSQSYGVGLSFGQTQNYGAQYVPQIPQQMHSPRMQMPMNNATPQLNSGLNYNYNQSALEYSSMYGQNNPYAYQNYQYGIGLMGK